MVEIGETIELSEGDLVLTFNKTLDLMRQVREMLADVMPEHPLRRNLHEAERLIRRGIVEQSLTLGFAPIETANDAKPDPPVAEKPALATNGRQKLKRSKKHELASSEATVDS
jgi:ATP-dependent RNA helicase HelY